MQKKVKHDEIQTWSVLCQYQFIYQISSQYLNRLQRKVRKTEFLRRAITPVKVRQVWQISNLICIMSILIHIPNFKSTFQKAEEKSLENKVSTKGNNPCKSRSSVTKFKLDLFYVNTNSYFKFQVNISKDGREKSGKLRCGGQTDGEQTKSPPASR